MVVLSVARAEGRVVRVWTFPIATTINIILVSIRLLSCIVDALTAYSDSHH